jgi:hypothetical protein
MEPVLYIVIHYQGRWYVKLQGNRHGPYADQKAAIEDAIKGAQTVPDSQVLVETQDNEIKAEWTWGDDPPRS